MAEGDITLYNSFYLRQADGSIDLDTDTLKVALAGPSYTPDIDTHDTFSDITNEIVASGYTAGGATLAGVSLTQDNTNDLVYLDANNVTWTSLATTGIAYAILYSSTSTYLIGYMAISTNSNGNDYSINWHANGILQIAQG